jgi:hypothetical protein
MSLFTSFFNGIEEDQEADQTLRVGDTVTFVDSSPFFQNTRCQVIGIYLPILILSHSHLRRYQTQPESSTNPLETTNLFIHIGDIVGKNIRKNGQPVKYSYEDSLTPAMIDSLQLGDMVTIIDSSSRQVRHDHSFIGEVFWVGSILRKSRKLGLIKPQKEFPNWNGKLRETELSLFSLDEYSFAKVSQNYFNFWINRHAYMNDYLECIDFPNMSRKSQLDYMRQTRYGACVVGKRSNKGIIWENYPYVQGRKDKTF